MAADDLSLSVASVAALRRSRSIFLGCLMLAATCLPAVHAGPGDAVSKAVISRGGNHAQISPKADGNRTLLTHSSKTAQSIALFPGQGILLVAGGDIHADDDLDGVLDAGESIDYTYTVINLGDSPLSSVALVDSIGAVTCPQTALAVGASMVCTRTYVITANDATDGAVVNQVEATGQDGSAAPVQAADVLFTQNLAGAAGIRMFKSPQVVSDADASENLTQGDLLRYRFVIKNSGAEPLSAVTLSEPDPSRIDTAIACDALTLDGQPFAGNGSGTLASGQTVLCSADYTVRNADILIGQVLNVAEVRASAPVAGQIFASGASAVVSAVGDRAIGLVKSVVSGSPFDLPGDEVVYSYTVTNIGTLALAGPVTVSDDKVAVTCPALSSIGNGDNVFDVGEVIICSATYTVVEADWFAGAVTNLAQAFADGVVSNEDTATVPSANGPPVPTIGVSKAIGLMDGTGPFRVRFDIRVVNFGVIPLNAVQVTENLRDTFPLPVDVSVLSLIVGGTAVANTNFNGLADINLLNSAQSTLAVDGEITIQLLLQIDPRGQRGPFFNTVTASGVGANDVVVSDVSVSGTNPDPDGDGIPDEGGPTPISFPSPPPTAVPAASFWSLLLLALVMAGIAGAMRREV